MSQLPDGADQVEDVEEGSPPLQFGARRLYYQYSVTIPQIQLVLASVLQGIVFTILLTKPIPIPNHVKPDVFFLFQLPYLIGFFQGEYFYLPYIVTALVIIIAWMDYVYAVAVLIWPPTPLQASLIVLLTLAEIAMASTVSPIGIALWRSSLGLTTVIGGIMRFNNVRIFTAGDFADLQLGEEILSNERKYGIAYVVLGSFGTVIGMSYYVILSWVGPLFPSLNAADRFLHWILYLIILLEICGVLIADSRYRQYLLTRLTRSTKPPLEVTRYGGIRFRRDIPVDKQEVPEVAKVETTLPNGGSVDLSESQQGRNVSIQNGSPDQKVGGEMDLAEDITTFDRQRLYYLWEKGQWSARDIDLTQDRIDWHEKLTNEQRAAIHTILAMFLDGEQIVARDLAPFVRAASQLESRVFLTTQIADEGKHHVFFDRFFREVVGVGHSMESALEEVQPHLSSSYKQIFAELDRVTDQLSRRPGDAPLLVQAIVLYHLVAEGIAHTGQHFLAAFGAKTKLLPGFTQGINLIARDESRHIAFGLLWLRELITINAKCRARAIRTIKQVLPWMAGMLFLPEFVHSLGIAHRDACIFTLRTLETRFRRIGISPAETQLVALGHADSPEKQADTILTLMECGAFASDGILRVTEKAMDMIFDGIYSVAVRAQERHRKLHATIQWIFDEIAPRYLVISPNKGVLTEAGIIAKRDLTLRVTSADWTRILLGQLHPLRALLTGRLRITGNWSMAFRLSRILSMELHTD